MKIIRVFPRRTSMTPGDDYAFVGGPPLFLPEAAEAHISCTFSWDIPKAQRLVKAWGQYYSVKIGGPAFGTLANGFQPGFYIKQGVTFTSRGCNNQCPWCLVSKQEGKIQEIEIHAGNRIQDNNLLQCSKSHIAKVFDMLQTQRGISFSGGLDSRLLKDWQADALRGLRIKELFFACDTKEAIKPLRWAKTKLNGFTRNQLRCYVLLAYGNETISGAQERLKAIWYLGFMPFAQLYQPPDKYIHYSQGWRTLTRTWSRPAAMKTVMKEERDG